MCLVEESLTTVEAFCSTLKCSCSTGILPVGAVGILPADCSRAAINGQDARLPHRQDACATSEESLDPCGPRKHFTLPFFHNPAIGSIAHTPCLMSKVCSITGSRVTRGSIIHRRGMAKKKGGVGRHVTKNV